MAGGNESEYAQPLYPEKLNEPVDKCGGDDADLNELAAEVLALRVKAGVAVIEQA